MPIIFGAHVIQKPCSARFRCFVLCLNMLNTELKNISLSHPLLLSLSSNVHCYYCIYKAVFLFNCFQLPVALLSNLGLGETCQMFGYVSPSWLWEGFRKISAALCTPKVKAGVLQHRGHQWAYREQSYKLFRFIQCCHCLAQYVEDTEYMLLKYMLIYCVNSQN